MTALPITPSNDVHVALQSAHDYLSLSRYDRADAYATYDKAHALRVARWYIEEAEPAADREPSKRAIHAYKVLSEVLAYQFDFLSRYIDVTFTIDDPYSSSSELIESVLSTGEIRVFKTPPGHHPVMDEGSHDQFRAVHDLLGHCAWRNSFGPKGEDAAYLSHAATLPPEALPAICSETRGQNTTFNYGHLVDGREPHQYARQSWLTSPEWVWRKGL